MFSEVVNALEDHKILALSADQTLRIALPSKNRILATGHGHAWLGKVTDGCRASNSCRWLADWAGLASNAEHGFAWPGEKAKCC